jgi:hypothetical protein
MALESRDLRRFRTGRLGIPTTELALVMAVIVGLAFVGYRVLTMGDGSAATQAAASASAMVTTAVAPPPQIKMIKVR